FGLAHELGHVMGASHAWITDNSAGVFPYSHGYQFTNANQIYGDIMSYAFIYTGPNGLPGEILPYYSNPQVTWAGVPIGRAANLDHPADNATTLNITGPTAAAFRPTKVPSSSIVNVTNLGDSTLTLSAITFNPSATWISAPVALPLVLGPGGN